MCFVYLKNQHKQYRLYVLRDASFCIEKKISIYMTYYVQYSNSSSSKQQQPQQQLVKCIRRSRVSLDDPKVLIVFLLEIKCLRRSLDAVPQLRQHGFLCLFCLNKPSGTQGYLNVLRYPCMECMEWVLLIKQMVFVIRNRLDLSLFNYWLPWLHEESLVAQLSTFWEPLGKSLTKGHHPTFSSLS